MAETAFERLRTALEGNGSRVTGSGDKLSAQCPAHDDHNASLSVTGIAGQSLVYCHAGCATENVMVALSLTMADLYDDKRGATYRYDDGRTVHRSPDKRFRQSGHKGTDTTLYRLEKVRAAVTSGKPVFVAEGEKDIHALESLGLTATCSPMGAGKAHLCDWTPLQGAQVLIIADKDKPGGKHARDVRTILSKLDAKVAIFTAKVGKDAADHIAAGHAVRDFEPITEYPSFEGEQGEWRLGKWYPDHPGEPAEQSRRLITVPASTVKPRRVRWLWPSRIPLGGLTLLAGREGLGKSTVAVDLSAQITRGTLDGECLGQPRTVVYIASEDARDYTVVPRLMAAGADLERVLFIDAHTEYTAEGPVVLPQDIDQLTEIIRAHDVAVVVLDAATSVLDGRLDGDRDRQMRQALEPVSRMAADLSCSVLGIVHFGKRESADTGRLILGSIAWSQVARSVLAVARDDDSGNLVLSTTKHNLAPGETPSLALAITETTVDTAEGLASVGKVAWLGETEHDARDLLDTNRSEDRSERDEAADWLREYLTLESDARATDVLKAARSAGLKEGIVQKVRMKIATTQRHGFGKDAYYTWMLKPSMDAMDVMDGARTESGIHDIHGESMGTTKGDQPWQPSLSVSTSAATGATPEDDFARPVEPSEDDTSPVTGIASPVNDASIRPATCYSSNATVTQHRPHECRTCHRTDGWKLWPEASLCCACAGAL